MLKEKRTHIKWGGGGKEHGGTVEHPVNFNETLTQSGHDFSFAKA